MAAGDRSIVISFVDLEAVVVKEPNPLTPVVIDAVGEDPDLFLLLLLLLDEDLVTDNDVDGVKSQYL